MKKINLIDLLVISIIILFIALGATYFSPKEQKTNKQVLLTMKVTVNADTVYPEAQKTKTVYFDSVNKPVEETGVENRNGDIYITVRADGSLENGEYIFNGTRVLVGQKAELHGTYFAQGVITEVKYAN
jgi:hypothetical protein